MKLEKVWVSTLFKTYKAVVIKRNKFSARVQLVGYPFGCYPNGKELIVPIERLSERKIYRYIRTK